MTTEWLARRVGERILCGRQVDGRYVCQGELARVESLLLDGALAKVFTNNEVVTLPTGYVEDPPSSHHWRLSSRARRQMQEHRQPVGTQRKFAGPPVTNVPDVPYVQRGFPGPDWSRECPHCGCTARVTSAVL